MTFTSPPSTFQSFINTFALLAICGSTLYTAYSLQRINARLSTSSPAAPSVPIPKTVPEPTTPTTPPPPPAPPVAPHTVYTIKPGDRTIYGIFQAHCRGQKGGYLTFKQDMLALGKEATTPHPLNDEKGLERIKAGQTWWFPKYCTF